MSTCEVCNRAAPTAEHPCRFEQGCSCWYGEPCLPVEPAQCPACKGTQAACLLCEGAGVTEEPDPGDMCECWEESECNDTSHAGAHCVRVATVKIDGIALCDPCAENAR